MKKSQVEYIIKQLNREIAEMIEELVKKGYWSDVRTLSKIQMELTDQLDLLKVFCEKDE